ncbi:tigger transposable element-derived protein 4-like [Cotesia glomerata]|uniref:tigger transposable element-derived protein 4-like n=1 Tax=Cotesia glomerata TaxID=32391 RepID=UPI001D005C75|nr:tigger transposable element-derived protein 4-like [Cotesia glomerata]
MKRSRLSEFPDVEKCLLEWIKQTMDKNIPIDGPLLKEKSKQFASKLGINNFLASNGWLDGFKRRHNIAFKKLAGESKSVDQRVCSQWETDLPHLLHGYDPEDIYNADETALFYKCLPDRTFIFKGEQCHRGKKSKERPTILQCTNMTGTDKLPLLIIGKSKKPRCFKGVKTLPVDYESNTKAWMTKKIFKSWLIKLDKDMHKQKKKIILFIDNCSAHVDVPTLSNVKVIFLPANTTSKLQPLDQGIIHVFKRLYRREVVKYILKCIEQSIDPGINVLLAMKFARKSWYTVSDITIQNCFKKDGFWNGLDENENSR